jgi:TonB family protein
MRRLWGWCAKWLPEDRTNRYLVVTVIVSVLFHVLVGVALIASDNIEQRRITKRGETILVDIAPDKPKESAPLGDPSRRVGPNVPEPPRQAAPPAPPTPPARRAAPAPPAPRVAEAPKATPAAPKSAEPTPAPKAAPPAPDPGQDQTARATPQQPAAQPQPPADQRVASVPPLPSPPEWMRKGGGGGLKGGRGGIEGEPVPLDTPDPDYQDYFNQIRERIKSKWTYPEEAARRGIDGELLIEFGIAKTGELAFIDKRRSSNIIVLDYAAMHAVELASPFPPVPDAIRKTGGLAILGTFRYQIIDETKLINRILR